MFEIEKIGSKTPPKFEYELETSLKEHPIKAKQIIAEIDEKLKRIKESLRVGTDRESFMSITLLLHGYLAYKKVIEKFLK